MIHFAVADDNAQVRSSMCRFLETEDDFVCAGAVASAEEAIALLQTRHVDVLLLDLSMPGLGGLAALPRMRAVAPHVSVVIFTAFAAVDVRQQALQAGASAFLEKLCAPSDIVDAIREAYRKDRGTRP